MNAPPNLVGRVSAVLSAVSSQEPTGATTSEISRRTGIARPTVHRLLTSLFGEGLIDRDPHGAWLLGPELYLLGRTAGPRYDVTSLAQPVVRRLAQTTGESAFFSARRGREAVCLIREEGSFPIRSHVLHEGIRFPLGVASAGLAILSYCADSEIDRYLSEFRDIEREYGSQHSATELRPRVQQTREAGYALNPGLIVDGSWGMAAAVFDSNEEPQWALSLTGIQHRFTAARRRKLGTLLLRAAHELTSVLRRR